MKISLILLSLSLMVTSVNASDTRKRVIRNKSKDNNSTLNNSIEKNINNSKEGKNTIKKSLYTFFNIQDYFNESYQNKNFLKFNSETTIPDILENEYKIIAQDKENPSQFLVMKKKEENNKIVEKIGIVTDKSEEKSNIFSEKKLTTNLSNKIKKEEKKEKYIFAGGEHYIDFFDDIKIEKKKDLTLEDAEDEGYRVFAWKEENPKILILKKIESKKIKTELKNGSFSKNFNPKKHKTGEDIEDQDIKFKIKNKAELDEETIKELNEELGEDFFTISQDTTEYIEIDDKNGEFQTRQTNDFSEIEQCLNNIGNKQYNDYTIQLLYALLKNTNGKPGDLKHWMKTAKKYKTNSKEYPIDILVSEILLAAAKASTKGYFFSNACYKALNLINHYNLSDDASIQLTLFSILSIKGLEEHFKKDTKKFLEKNDLLDLEALSKKADKVSKEALEKEKYFRKNAKNLSGSTKESLIEELEELWKKFKMYLYMESVLRDIIVEEVNNKNKNEN